MDRMRAPTPQGQGDGPGSARRSSIEARRLRASSGTGIARPQTSLRESRIGSMRGASNQPSYNLFTGETSSNNPARPSSRQSAIADNPYSQSQRAISHESSKENQAPPDAEQYETQRRRIEELKAEVGTLKYTINTYDQEKEMARLQHETELRDMGRRAEEDFKKRQASDAEKATAERKLEALQGELETIRDGAGAREKELERKARAAQDEARLLQEQLEDLSAAKDDAERINGRWVVELQTQVTTAQRTAQELELENQAREALLQEAQERLVEKDAVVGTLEAEVLRLKAQTGDAATMEVIRRELTDQVSHIRTLEATNREQLTELKHLRQMRKSVEVVEEEKRSLQRKLETAETMERQLAEERIQRQRLDDERQEWAAYFSAAEFDSPAAMGRALTQERYQVASLVEKLGSIEPELAQRDVVITSLETQVKELSGEVEKLKLSGGSPAPGSGADKARQRLERQRALAIKEVEYLRTQLKTFDTEEVTFQPENFDQKKSERIQELEDLVDNYKLEMQTLHAELSSREGPDSSPAQPFAAAGTKRPRPDDAQSEQLGQLARKNRKLQDDLSSVQAKLRLVEKDLSVAKEQVAAAREASRTRILSMRSNPTSDFEAVKTATLTALRTENTELLQHIQSPSRAATYPTIPMSVLAAAQREIAEAQAATASAEKSARRLKEVWAAKSAEFKEAIFSTLGWTVTFIPNGKMRVESVYHPSVTDEHENSIVFDGERGTMKVGGGPRSAFATRIADQIGFWVREKGCIPGFLAALTLEFYEEHTRASRPVDG